MFESEATSSAAEGTSPTHRLANEVPSLCSLEDPVELSRKRSDGCCCEYLCHVLFRPGTRTKLRSTLFLSALLFPI